MRWDMGKVVLERPRKRSWSKSPKIRCFGKLTFDGEDLEYDGLLRVPLSDRAAPFTKKLERKSFSDLLGPIERYLDSKIGRPWDEIWSEASKILGSGTEPTRHVANHLRHMVILRTFEINGKLWHCDGGKMKPVLWESPARGRVVRYVSPEGVLQRWLAKPKPRKIQPQLEVVENQPYAVKISGLWFLGEYSRHEVKKYFPQLGEWPSFYSRGALWVFRKKKQLNKKELRNPKLFGDGPVAV